MAAAMQTLVNGMWDQAIVVLWDWRYLLYLVLGVPLAARLAFLARAFFWGGE